MDSLSIMSANSLLFTYPEVVTFGESMALFMPSSGKSIEHASSMDISFGGAESNVAIGLARLGHHVGWFGRLGNDPLGRSILKKIRGEGVDVSRAELVDHVPTGLMLREEIMGRTSVHYYRRNSPMSLMEPIHLDETYISKAKVLHVTGITAALSESCLRTVIEAIRIAKANGVKVCFDPNLRLKLWKIEEAREVLVLLAKEVDYFLPGLDECKLIYQVEDFASIIEKLSTLKAISVVKGGINETYLVENGQVSHIPYHKANNIVDTIGAGDGFCAGFLSGLLKNLSLIEAVRLGNVLGCLVIQTKGDWEGLPSQEEVVSFILGIEHVVR